jgi:hypothetical protein
MACSHSRCRGCLTFVRRHCILGYDPGTTRPCRWEYRCPHGHSRDHGPAFRGQRASPIRKPVRRDRDFRVSIGDKRYRGLVQDYAPTKKTSGSRCACYDHQSRPTQLTSATRRRRSGPGLHFGWTTVKKRSAKRRTRFADPLFLPRVLGHPWPHCFRSENTYRKTTNSGEPCNSRRSCFCRPPRCRRPARRSNPPVRPATAPSRNSRYSRLPSRCI